MKINWLTLRRFNSVSPHYLMFAWFDGHATLVATFAIGVN